MSEELRRQPASLIQRQFWLAQQVDPQGSAYNIASAFLVRGEFSVEILKQSLLDIVARYDVLRATYEFVDGVLYQVVSPKANVLVTEHCISRCDDSTYLPTVQSLVDGEVSKPFELDIGPCVRLMIVRGDNPSVTTVCLTFHHSTIDLRTKDILGAELSSRYVAKRDGQSYAVDDPATQYSEYSQFQQEWLASSDAARATKFWVDNLREKSLAIPLIPDFPRPSWQTFQGDIAPFEFVTELSAELTRFCAAKKVDAFVVLLAAYYALLQRYSRCSDFAVGIPLTNRRDERFKDVVGCFVNTVPLTVKMDETVGFERLVRSVRTAMLLAHRNQETPLELIVKNIGARHDQGRNPMYQVGFTFEHPMRLHIDGCEIEALPCRTGGAQLELFLRCWHENGCWRGQLEYNCALFTRQSAQRFVVNFQTLLGRGMSDSSTPLGGLNILSLADEVLLGSWNETQRPYTCEPLAVAFERQVDKTPDAPAISFVGVELTYRQLETKANKLARYIMKRGVRTGDMVPVCFLRSIEMFVAIYAIEKVGGAYVPVDPTYPLQRIRNILSEVGESPIITTKEFAEMLGELESRLVLVDGESTEIEAENPDRLDAKANLNDLAYVIYTSGSTGKPKGVMNTHAGISNRLKWMQEQFPLGATDRVLAKTPYTFDVSVWEIFWALQVGASIEIAPPEVHRDPSELCSLLREAAITTVHFVPSMLDVYLAERWGEEPKSLKRVICSGETLSKDLQIRFFERLPGVELYNLYGPTEAAVDVTCWKCDTSELPIVPIGRAIANTQMHILDSHGHQVPIGVPGEICIGGIQVARGYVANETLTKERFVCDPYLGGKARLYRTGDLGRFLPDGSIQFLGRLDNQVKIRGNRIELAEIEAVLRTHPSVRDVAVLVRPMPQRDLQMVAYVVGQDADQDTLRRHVAAMLPDYMMPSYFVFMSELPLAQSGKLDTQSLLTVDLSRQMSRHEVVAAATETQKYLVELWRQALGVPEVSIRDNFFEIGGNSLLLTRIYGVLQGRYGKALRLASLFQFTTIESLACHLDGNELRGFSAAVEEARLRTQRVKDAYAKSRKRPNDA